MNDLFDLGKELKNLSTTVKVEIEKEVGKNAKLIQSQAKALAPVNTGNLRNNITTSTEWNGNECIGTISCDVEYGPYLEFGTGIYSTLGTGRQTPWVYKAKDGFIYTQGQPPQPFMYPAYNAEINNVFKNINNMLGRLSLND